MLATGPIIVSPSDAPGVAYSLKRPTTVDRLKYRQEITRLGGRQRTIGDMLQTLKAAADVMLADDQPGKEAVQTLAQAQLDKLQDYLDDIKARGEGYAWTEEAGERLLEAFRWPRQLEDFAVLAANAFPAYAQIQVDNEALPMIRGIAAAKVALTSIEGADIAIARRLGMLADDTLDRIPESHIVAMGQAYEAACTLSVDQKKASPLPSGGASGPPSSTDSSATPPSSPGSETPGLSKSSDGNA